MRGLAITLLTSTALATGLGQGAFAADLPAKARRVAPAPIALPYDWSGFYVGAHLGAGWGRKAFTDRGERCLEGGFDGFTVCAPSYQGSHTLTGPLGGFQAGLNWQVAPFLVLGIEGQYSFAHLRGDHQDTVSLGLQTLDGFTTITASDRFSTKIKGIATIAGRIGITGVPSDRTMFYVKGGAAYVKEDFRLSGNGAFTDCATSIDGFSCFASSFNSELSASQSRWGWMVGAGLEFGLFDNWTAKVEYNYLDFGTKAVRFEGPACETNGFFEECRSAFHETDVKQDLHVVKFGINYRFGGKAPVPVAARY